MTYKGLSLCLQTDKSEYHKNLKKTCIIPSHLHPHVLASNQLLLWTTPHTQSFQKCLKSELPANAVLKLFQVMLFSLDQDTCSNYG